MKVKDLKVIDVILMPEFEQGMQLCINDINIKMLARTNGPLKRSPIDRLKEQGLFGAKELVALYALALNKELNPVEYPSSIRRLIKEIGDAVLHKTVEYLKAKEEKVETIMIKKEENKDDKIAGIIINHKDIIKDEQSDKRDNKEQFAETKQR